ncbi:M23 family metallopeptidase [Candidatus Dojkabacteria bacterium]|uniref:M23 family metallopeptidase n=1 Tax=Candidatus Dojkabacteria bacterium TaxID=2099670 RepID=A0A955KZB5_9BACT|nr:M23 family metallopeptidase [Candidatus Dojkabacteria bacterium]HRN86907.1 M23 family metallopeptidase [Candidatus Dojkabacteria bacterium]HRO65559.1 M23 family metallopeptidase [Candidatus Dojkabacteria bacterium]HRP51161.1 M23 family metallopeptidase [Candidatus Dojkabacteria bacterium]
MKHFVKLKLLFLLFIFGLFYILFVYFNSTNKDIKNPQTAFESLQYHTCPYTLKVSGKNISADWIGGAYIVGEEGYYWIINNCEKFIESSPPILSNLGIAPIDFEAFDPATLMAGAFRFEQPKDDRKPISSFGEVKEYNYNYSLSFDFLEPGTDVIAALDSEVRDISFDMISSNYTLILSYNDIYQIYYSGVLDLQVSEGEKVKAGQVLGKLGLNDEGALANFQIRISKENLINDSTLYYCPLQLLPSETKAEYESKLKLLMEEWENFIDNSMIYEELDYSIPGCINEFKLYRPGPGPVPL